MLHARLVVAPRGAGPDGAARAARHPAPCAVLTTLVEQLRDVVCDFADDSRHANPWAAELYRKRSLVATITPTCSVHPGPRLASRHLALRAGTA